MRKPLKYPTRTMMPMAMTIMVPMRVPIAYGQAVSDVDLDIDEGEVVIHRVAARFIVRRGALTGCIVNKGFVGTGDRLRSGTVAPAVARERKGVE